MVVRAALWSVLLLAVAACGARPAQGQDAVPLRGGDSPGPSNTDAEPPSGPDDVEMRESPPVESVGGDWLSAGRLHGLGRSTGLGQPLQGTSWLNRPVYVGGFLGNSLGATLISNQVELEPEAMWGVWLGYDMSHYWGSEVRLALNYAGLTVLPDGADGGNSRNTLADISLLYYPWGDAQWRPYGAVGLGIGGFRYPTEFVSGGHHTGFAIPLGLGLKYLWSRRLALRFDARDNVMLGGSRVGTTHLWSLTGGIEFHWGSASAAQYYPWW